MLAPNVGLVPNDGRPSLDLTAVLRPYVPCVPDAIASKTRLSGSPRLSSRPGRPFGAPFLTRQKKAPSGPGQQMLLLDGFNVLPPGRRPLSALADTRLATRPCPRRVACEELIRPRLRPAAPSLKVDADVLLIARPDIVRRRDSLLG